MGYVLKGQDPDRLQRAISWGFLQHSWGSQLTAAISPEAPPTGLKPSLPQVSPPLGPCELGQGPSYSLSQREGEEQAGFSLKCLNF